MAHAVAQERRIVVRRVEPVRDPGRVEQLAQRRASLAEERPHDPPPPRRDPARARQPAAAQQVEQDRLGGVVGGVGGRDQRAVGRDVLEESVARLARGVLDRSALVARQRGDIGPEALEAQRQGLGRLGDEAGVVRAVGTERVVEVGDGQLPAAGIGLDQAGRAMQQGHRVGAAGDGQHEGPLQWQARALRAARDDTGKLVRGTHHAGEDSRRR